MEIPLRALSSITNHYIITRYTKVLTSVWFCNILLGAKSALLASLDVGGWPLPKKQIDNSTGEISLKTK